MSYEKKYVIKVPHFYCLEYFEQEKKMIIDIDFRETIFFLNKSLITKWEPPFDNELIQEDKKLNILNNIYEFLQTKTIPNNIIKEDF